MLSIYNTHTLIHIYTLSYIYIGTNRKVINTSIQSWSHQLGKIVGVSFSFPFTALDIFY